MIRPMQSGARPARRGPRPFAAFPVTLVPTMSLPVDVAAQQARINQLALQDVDALAEMQRLGNAELATLPAAIKQAAELKEYARAAELQLRIEHLKSRAEELAAARAMSVRSKRRKDPASLLPATQLKDNASSVWNERVRDVVAPLEVPVDTTLAVIAEGLRLAASEGVYEIKIRRAPDVDAALKSKHVWDPDASNSRAEHELRRASSYGDTAYQEKHELYLHNVTRTLKKVEYFVDVGFCWIPVGAGLGVPSDANAEIYDSDYKNDFATLHKHHRAFAGFTPEVERDAFCEMASAFDGDTTHLFRDVDTCCSTSEFARMLLRWKLNGAGYASKAHSGMDSLVKEWHRKNHAARVLSPTADVLSFRSEEFKRFVKPGSHPSAGGVMLTVAHGEQGERLRKGLGDGIEDVAGFTKTDKTPSALVEYVEACVSHAALDTHESGFYARRGAVGANAMPRIIPTQPEVLQAAGTASLRNVIAREKFWQRRRNEGEVVLQSPASPVSTPAGFAKTKTYTPSSASPSITPSGSTNTR